MKSLLYFYSKVLLVTRSCFYCAHFSSGSRTIFLLVCRRVLITTARKDFPAQQDNLYASNKLFTTRILLPIALKEESAQFSVATFFFLFFDSKVVELLCHYVDFCFFACSIKIRSIELNDNVSIINSVNLKLF